MYRAGRVNIIHQVTILSPNLNTKLFIENTRKLSA